MPDAARIGDNHDCPIPAAGPVPPHKGGPILPPGAPTVLMNGRPDARILDMALCIGPPDLIAQGSSLVLAAGLPSARKGDATGHGGSITMGSSDIEIGGAAVSMKVNGDAAFVAKLREALAKILPTNSGCLWLQQMAKNGRTVTFQAMSAANGQCTALNAANSRNGVGSDSVISWNPDYNSVDPSLPGAQGSPGAPVILAHEMVHALHNANGDNRNGPLDSFPGQQGSSSRNEERSTVGTSGYQTGPDGNPVSIVQQPNGTTESSPKDYSHDVPTENSFRDDLGIPRRPSYYPSNWPGGPPW